MPVPDFQSLMLPALKTFASGGEPPLSEVRERVAAAAGLSAEDVEEMLPSGRQAVFTNRVSWAVIYTWSVPGCWSGSVAVSIGSRRKANACCSASLPASTWTCLANTPVSPNGHSVRTGELATCTAKAYSADRRCPLNRRRRWRTFETGKE